MKKLILCLFGFLICSAAHANALSLSFGPSLDGTLGAQKVLGLGYELQWGAPSLEVESGMWTEPHGVAFYGGATFGVHVTSESGVFMRMGFGPNAVSETDERLSSIFEFHITLRAGVEMGSWSVWGGFNHWSNAGLVPPNLGRDVLCAGVSIPL